MGDVFFTSMYAFVALILLSSFLCFSEIERVRWYRRIRQCRWNVSVDDYLARLQSNPNDNNINTTSVDQPGRDITTGTKTSAFEAEIREAFLIDKMKSFSKTLKESDFVENLSPPREEHFHADSNTHTDYNDYIDTVDDETTTNKQPNVDDGNIENQRIDNVHDEVEMRKRNSYTGFVEEEIATISMPYENFKLSQYELMKESARSDVGDDKNVSVLLNVSVIPSTSHESKLDDGFTSDNNSSDGGSVDVQIVEDAFDDTDTCLRLPLAGTMYLETPEPCDDDVIAENHTRNEESKELDKTGSRDIEQGLVSPSDVPNFADNKVDQNTDIDIEKGIDADSSSRHVPGGCVICLCPYEVGERVTWSSNKECKHCFHDECILDWLKTSGRKSLKRARRNRDRSQPYNVDLIVEITSGPWSCPVCRQDFIIHNTTPEKVLSDSESQESSDEPSRSTEGTDVPDTVPSEIPNTDHPLMTAIHTTVLPAQQDTSSSA